MPIERAIASASLPKGRPIYIVRIRQVDRHCQVKARMNNERADGANCDKVDRGGPAYPIPGVRTRLTLSRVLQTRLACGPEHPFPVHLGIDGDRAMGLGDLTSRQAVRSWNLTSGN